MGDDRITKQLLFGQLSEGKRAPGRPVKRFKDCLKDSLTSLDIPTDTWESLAQDKCKWRSTVNAGVKLAENKRTAHAEQKREKRKARSSASTPIDGTHVCTTCGRKFLARIGLISHQRTHNR